MDADKFLREVVRIAQENGYEIEDSSNGIQIDFGNKKLHEKHLKQLFDLGIVNRPTDVADTIEKVAPGRPCTHKPMRKIIKKIMSVGRDSKPTYTTDRDDVMDEQSKLEEYKILVDNMRHYSNLRFAQLTLYFALCAGLLAIVFTLKPEIISHYRSGLMIVGILGSVAFIIMEDRVATFWTHFLDCSREIEKELNFKHYTYIHRPSKFRRTSGATMGMILLGGTCWVILLFVELIFPR